MSGWRRVDASWLPAGWREDEIEDGLRARFHDDGQLHELELYRRGVCLMTLKLEPGEAAGRATTHQGSGGSADWTTYENGAYENFDAWSDNSRPCPCDWETWVRSEIRRMTPKDGD